MKFSLLSAAVVCALSGSAFGQITAFDFVDVDNSAGGSALQGFNTTDVTVDFDSRWTGSQLLIELTQGSVYIDPVLDPWGGPGNALTQAAFPSSSFGTYVTLNAREASQLPGVMNTDFELGAVNLGGAPQGSIDAAGVNAAWSYLPPLPFPAGYFDAFQDQDDFLVSRVTLSDDAEGTFTVLASAGGIISVEDATPLIAQIGTSFDAASAVAMVEAMSDQDQGLQVAGQITAGAFVVPEPTGLGVLAVSSAFVLLRRRAA